MNLNWYDTLNKPIFTPPSDVFAPAWTILYILIFLSLVLFLTQKSFESKKAGIILFLIQLVLNFLWSPVCFYWHNTGLALVVIILLIITVIATMAAFYRVSHISAFLLVPYLLWLIFAAYLNFGFLILN